MPVVPDPVINKHWFVAAFLLADEDHPLGMLSTIDGQLFSTVEAAKLRAKTLAALSPGAYYVVYSAEWYAWTDITPVSLRRVGMAAI